ncbi:MAG TPA: TolC family protein [Bacillota bacterium]|nr:TolC family protein [Bacillota bacterium]
MMKRRILLTALAALVLLGAGAASFSGERAIVPDMNFVGDPIDLSLVKAVEIMQTTGSRAEAAALNKAADEAVARGYKESAKSISDFLNAIKGASISVSSAAEESGMTETNEKIMRMRRDFAKEQVASNYQAELNEIEAMTVQVYYGVLQAQENLKISKDNLQNQKAIYDNTMKKYKLGMVARIDTLTAETQVLSAEDQAAAAETALKNARMNFNLLLGYDLMQNVVLTDGLKMAEEPKGSLTGFIESAVKNRNEIKGAAFGAEIQEILLTSLKYRYPSSSSTYLNQETATLLARKAAQDAPVQIEMDIRARYMDMADKKRAVKVAEASLANAKEGYRLATISYNAGMNTLTDVQKAQIASYQAALGVAAAITDYDLAVYGFIHATGAGTVRLPL